MVPKIKATATERKMARMTDKALSVFSKSAKVSIPVLSDRILISERMNVPPNNSNTIDTVVDVGIPNVLNTSSSTTSVTITARKMQSRSLKLNIWGWKIPCRAMSIMPLLIEAPTNTPMEAIIRMVRKRATFAPMAEFRKFTASLLTPTIKSMTANRNRNRMKLK